MAKCDSCGMDGAKPTSGGILWCVDRAECHKRQRENAGQAEEDRLNGAALRALIATGEEFNIEHVFGGQAWEVWLYNRGLAPRYGVSFPEAVNAALADPEK